MPDYRILSPHYNGNLVPVSSIPKNIEPKLNILGQTHEPPTIGSHMQFEGMSPIVYQKPNGEFFARHSTSGNPFRWEVPVEDAFEHRYFSPQLEDIGFGTWKDMEKPQAVEYVKHPQRSIRYGIVETFEERKLKLTERDTPVRLFVHDMDYNGPINEFGRYSHLARNIKQHLMEYYGLKSTQELVSFMEANGLTLEDIGYLAVASIPGIYGVARAPDGKVIFLASENSNDLLVEDARHFGIPTKIYRTRAIDEEQMHIARKSYDKINSLSDLINEEVATKSMLGDAYAKRGDKKLVELMEEDIKTTPKRYRESYGRHQRNLDDIAEDADEGHVAFVDNRYATQNTKANGKVVYMPARTSAKGNKKEDYGEKGRVIYGQFGDSRKTGKAREDSGNEGREAKSRYAKAASKSAESREAATETADGESSGDAPQGEASAEAA